ncbi:MAG: M13 family metallopeptidase [Gammaproteobacteria bacterium]|nr:M13 family metallopeptidase [Gammaproteobacteria bacterium]
MTALRLSAALCAALLLLACTPPAPRPTEPPAQIAPWGLDLAGRDTSVKPGDDFYHYAVGHWVDTHPVPADRSNWGSFDELEERAESQVIDIVQALPPDAPPGSNAQKVGDYYRAYLDTARIDELGLQPVQGALSSIAAAKNHHDLIRLMGRPDMALRAPLRIGITLDQKDPDHYAVVITQGGLGMPDRDYYLKDEPQYRELREKYRAHIARLLALVGDAPAAAQAEAQAILDTETHIAQLHWPAAKRRERDLTYNPRTRPELEQMVPGFYWETLLATLGVDAQPRFVVRETDAVQQLAAYMLTVPVDTWKAYFRYHYVVSVAPVLPQAIDAEVFDFYGRTLHGQPEQRARPRRAVTALDRDLGEAVGELYVQRYFPPASRAQVRALVENLRAAYAAHLEQLPWMTPPTRKVALEKLAAFRPKLGYPDKWRDYSELSIVKGDAFGNYVRAQLFEWRREVVRLPLPSDRDEWGMTPQTINAYYNPTFNEVVFPAAILQPPFFDPHADAAVNYGAIGAVIGHEMGHGFDDQGAKSDAKGVLRTWWAAEDTEAFHKRTDQLAAQYDTFTALPGLKVNGRLTLGENIGDLGGLSVAHEAYHRALGGRTPPLRDGLTGEQRFFLAFAQVWRANDRPEALRSQVLSDPHSPPQFRVNGVVRNVDAWYEAFNVQPGDKLYLPPAERVRIW